MLAKQLIELGYCTAVCRVLGMSREKWLEKRRSGIGGSDAGAIMGLNKWATPLTVYFAKKNIEKEQESDNLAIQWGNMAENAIRSGVAKELGVKAVKVPYMFRSLENPFMIADLDGLVFAENETDVNGQKVQGLGGLEIKTTTRFNNEFKDDEIPDSYFCQVQHYMAVTGLKWFILAVMIDRVGGKMYVIPRNEGFIEQLIEKERVFWQEFVEADIPPAPTGSDRELEYIAALPMAESVELDCEELFDEKEQIDLTIKDLKAKSDALKAQILLNVAEKSDGSAEKTVATAGQWKITYSTQERKTADVKALEKDGLTDYIKTSSSRVARFTRIKA